MTQIITVSLAALALSLAATRVCETVARRAGVVIAPREDRWHRQPVPLFTTRFEGLSRAVFVLDWLLLAALLGGSRLAFRLLGEFLRAVPADSRRVLIYGPGDGGELLLRELRNNAALKREPVGFLDDDRSKLGMRIQEVPVLGGLEEARAVLQTHRIGEVIISSGKISAERLRLLESICSARGVAIVRGSLRLE